MQKLLKLIKRLVSGLWPRFYKGSAFVVMLPYWVLSKFTKFIYISQAISLIPFEFGEVVRYQFYKRTLPSCGKNVTINFGTVLSYNDITIGNNVWIGQYNIIGHADIGDYTLTAQGCHIVSGAYGHPFDNTTMPIIMQSGNPGRVSIGPDIWLGAGVIVLANIGKGCVVGAGSVVNKDLPDWAVAVGVPAKVIRYRKSVTEKI